MKFREINMWNPIEFIKSLFKSKNMPYKKSIGTKTTVSAKKVKASVKPIKKAVKQVVGKKKK